MIEFRSGDLLKQDDLDIIIHQCNIHCIMEAGIAKQIAKKWPEVLEADKRTKAGDIKKLGSWTEATLDNGLVVINMYSQKDFGTDKCQTDYNAMEKALSDIKDEYDVGIVDELKIGIPYNIGCGLAGGNWNKVKNILNKVFSSSKTIKLIIVRLP